MGQKHFKYRTFIIWYFPLWDCSIPCDCKTTNIILQKKSNVKLSRTIIYGTDANAISVAKALKLESPLRFKIVAFIDRMGKIRLNEC
jgi:FlaA1/EpsC-like NDP-sugar epimerase